MSGAAQVWAPSQVERVIHVIGTSTRPAIVKTDVGDAYAKALGNPEGPHVLACEWLGLQLAKWLGMPTLDVAIVDLDEACVWELDPGDPTKGRVAPGPALVTRAVKATTWDGYSDTLEYVANPGDLVGLVVVDTWLRNPDRYCPDGERIRRNVGNVLLSEEGAPPGHYVVTAMDFSHAVSGGRGFDASCWGIDAIRDERVYGCFPEFQPFLSAGYLRPFLDRLRGKMRDFMDMQVGRIPTVWGLRREDRAKLVEFVVQRASHLGDTLERRLRDEWSLAGGRG
jgi:hypothetical protein